MKSTLNKDVYLLKILGRYKGRALSCVLAAAILFSVLVIPPEDGKTNNAGNLSADTIENKLIW